MGEAKGKGGEEGRLDSKEWRGGVLRLKRLREEGGNPNISGWLVMKPQTPKQASGNKFPELYAGTSLEPSVKKYGL